MLSISPDAAAVIRQRNQPIHLDMPPVVRGGCCLPDLQECPTVRFGPPPEPEKYVEQSIGGITVYVPRRMPVDEKLTIAVSSFLGIRRVVLEGWRLL